MQQQGIDPKQATINQALVVVTLVLPDILRAHGLGEDAGTVCEKLAQSLGAASKSDGNRQT